MSALSFGAADFAARFTSRGLGAPRALFGILIVSGVILTSYVLLSGAPSIAFDQGLWLIFLQVETTHCGEICGLSTD